jgi:NADPH:quinone reductase-like Zn-dependent oxidoreductase
MPWQHIRISRFGGPEVLELAEQPTLPEPGPDEVRIKVLAAGTGFTDTFIRRGRYPDFKGPLPFTPGYDLVGVVEQTGRGVTVLRQGQVVADLCVIGGYAQYAIRPARFLVTVPDGVDPAKAVCIPLAYLTAFQMLTRYRRLLPGATILVIGASGTVGTALLDLARHLGLKAIGTCSAANLAAVERFGAIAIDYRAGDFVAAVRRLTASRKGGAGVDAAFDAIGGAHFSRSFACLASGGLLVGYGSQTMAVGSEGLASAALGLARIKLWGVLSSLFGGRNAVFYSITARRLVHPEEFKADMASLFDLLRDPFTRETTPACPGMGEGQVNRTPTRAQGAKSQNHFRAPESAPALFRNKRYFLGRSSSWRCYPDRCRQAPCSSLRALLTASTPCER